MEYIIVGAGGHGRVILDILIAQNKAVAGFIDDNEEEDVLGVYPILGKKETIVELIETRKDIKFIIAIGDNEARKKIVQYIQDYNGQFGKAIHPSSIVSNNVKIGLGTVVMPNVIINNATNVGQHVILNTASTIDHDCNIQDFVHVSPGVNLAGDVTVGIGSHIGIGACVIPRIKIGNNVIVGAGGVVVKDIVNNVVAVGCPTKIIKKAN
ncbi:acetyltransferase [Bacillus toyonensis]|uniref:acetyltransferase n=1 Tax=Bacillus toyonensis TaxID=155322 RepID=UPI000BECFFA2|nr:acetyltransferase [Bacillus toyonensis]PED96596.1 acetyltransferase [Bacillus toyonensis]PEK46822.1 acetyltransferase [Bacillus toyonensis]PEL61739.1 acetyltransferase [Bacillus toyonensis]PFZ40378.1 acetyltransferase [Bacillus toyonensis]UKS60205.1 acetyltransferase [Bacillus toyonensis]